MTNFWTYESKDTHNRRASEKWVNKARQDAWEMLALDKAEIKGIDRDALSPMSSGNVFDPWEDLKLKAREMDEIVPQVAKKKGGGVLGVLDDVTSGIFLGEVRQPWDLLRPVQRVLEAEQKYIAEPVTRKLYEGITGKSYDDTNEIFKFGAEALFSPSSWVGPGLLGKVAKAAKLAPGLTRFAASESLPEYLARSVIPNVAGSAGAGIASEIGLPAWAGMPVGALSAKGVDMHYGRPGRVGTLKNNDPVSLIISDGDRVFHGSWRIFDDINPDKAGANYGTNTFPGSFYVTKDPDVAEAYATYNPKRSPDVPPYGANVKPLLVMPGTKLFDPDEDFLLGGYIPLAESAPTLDRLAKATGLPKSYILQLDQKLRTAALTQDRYREQLKKVGAEGAPAGPLFDEWAVQDKVALQKLLKAEGYKGISTEHEMILWDKEAIRPLYTITGKSEPARLAKGFAQKNRELALALPGLLELFGAAPGSARVLSMVAPGSDDLDPEVAKLIGLGDDTVAESAGMQSIDRDTARQYEQVRKPSKAPSFLEGMEPGKTASATSGNRNLKITAKGDGTYDVVESGTSINRGDFTNTYTNVSYDDLKMRFDSSTWPDSVTKAGDGEAKPLNVQEARQIIQDQTQDFQNSIFADGNKPLLELSGNGDGTFTVRVSIRPNDGEVSVAGSEGLANRTFTGTPDEIAKEISGWKPEPETPLEKALRLSIEANKTEPGSASTAGRVLASDYTEEMRARDAETSERFAERSRNRRVAADADPKVKAALEILNKRERGEKVLDSTWRDARDLLRSRGLWGGKHVGGAASESERMAELIENMRNAPDDLFGVRTREEAIQFERYRASQTQRARRKIAQTLSNGTVGTNIVNFFKQRGIALEDSDIVHLINFYMEKEALGANYGAKAGDELRHIREAANKSHVLTTEEIKHKVNVPGKPWNPLDSGSTAIKVTDPRLVAQAEQLAAANPDWRLMEDGILHFSDLRQYANEFDLTPDQRAFLENYENVMRPHYTMESYFGFEPQDNPHGYPVSRVLMSTLQPIEEAGLLREAPGGPVVARRVGSRQSLEVPDALPSMSAGYAEGNKYLPSEEELAARIARGYKRMADDWLKRSVEEYGKKAEDFLPADLTKQVQAAKREVQRINRLNRDIGRAIFRKATWFPPKWSSDIPAVNDLVADITLANQNKNNTARRAELKLLRERAQLLLKDAKDIHEPLKEKRALLVKQVQAGGESKARGQYQTEWQGQYYPSGYEPLAELDRIEHPSTIERKLNTFNETVRPIMATLDASFAGVQGLVAFFAHPTNWLTAMSNLTSAGYEAYMNRKLAGGQFDRFIQSGGHWAARNDFAEFLAPTALQRLPGIGGMVKTTNNMFQRFGNILRLEIFDAALSPKMLGTGDDAIKQRMELARHANLITGYTPKNPSQAERTALFAPRFFRSQLGLLADAVTKHDISNAGAARAMGLFLLGGGMLTYALNEALGNETDFDPSSSNFMRVRVGGSDVSIFGTWDTLARAVAKSSDGSEDGFEYLARVKASPAIRTLWDVFEGETLGGETLDSGSPRALIESAGKIAAGMGPISGTTLLKEPPDLSNPASLGVAATQLFGVKSTPMSPSEEMTVKRESLAQREYKTNWDSLEPHQKDKLRKENNLEVESTTELSKAFDARSNISERFTAQQQRIDSRLPIGEQWIEARRALRREQVGAYAQWAEEHPEALAKIRHSNPKNMNDAALQKQYAIFDQASQEDWSPDELSDTLQKFEESLSPDQLSYIERNTGLRDTPREKEYKAAQKILRPYWEISDQVWDRLAPRLGDTLGASNLQDYTIALINKLKAEGVPDRIIARRVQSNPVLREIDRATTTLRTRLRKQRPEIDAELVKWYGRKPAA